jgi:hypothetical protein
MEIMVRVIEQKSDAGEWACVEFRVYRKPADPAVIFGEMFFIEQEGPRAASISTSDMGVPVEKAFLGTIGYANEGYPSYGLMTLAGCFRPRSGLCYRDRCFSRDDN